MKTPTAPPQTTQSQAPPSRRARRTSSSARTTSPPAKQWAQQLAVAVIDAIGGRRQVRSVQRWMTPEVFRQVRAAAEANPRKTGSLPAIAMASRVFVVSDEVVEFAVTVWDQGKARAVAGRLVRLRERWHLTDLETH